MPSYSTGVTDCLPVAKKKHKPREKMRSRSGAASVLAPFAAFTASVGPGTSHDCHDRMAKLRPVRWIRCPWSRRSRTSLESRHHLWLYAACDSFWRRPTSGVFSLALGNHTWPKMKGSCGDFKNIAWKIGRGSWVALTTCNKYMHTVELLDHIQILLPCMLRITRLQSRIAIWEHLRTPPTGPTVSYL